MYYHYSPLNFQNNKLQDLLTQCIIRSWIFEIRYFWSKKRSFHPYFVHHCESKQPQFYVMTVAIKTQFLMASNFGSESKIWSQKQFSMCLRKDNVSFTYTGTCTIWPQSYPKRYHYHTTGYHMGNVVGNRFWVIVLVTHVVIWAWISELPAYILERKAFALLWNTITAV